MRGMERREAQLCCRRVTASPRREAKPHRASPCGAPSTLVTCPRLREPQSPAREHRCKQQHPLRRFRREDPRKLRAGTGEGVALRGPRNESARSSTHSFRRLSPPLVRSASRRKRHLPVVGEGGSTSASRGACASRARRRRASFHFANASRSTPHE